MRQQMINLLRKTVFKRKMEICLRRLSLKTPAQAQQLSVTNIFTLIFARGSEDRLAVLNDGK
jgi:hypothetical protein